VSTTHRFHATIDSSDTGGAYVRIPFDVEAAFGKKRVPVISTIDGVPYRGSLVRMGDSCHVLGVLKDIRDKIGKQPGDEVEVTVDEDVAPRVVELPADLKQAIEDSAQAKEFYERLSYSKQREFALWVGSAKREATRADRVARSVELLAAGKKLR